MHDTHDNKDTAPDPLADIFAAAGRRAQPPQHAYEEVFAAAHSTWQRRLAAQRRRRWYAMAAAIGVVALAGALWQMFPAATSDQAAQLQVAQGTVEQRMPGTDTWRPLTAEQSLVSGTRLRTSQDGAAALRLSDGGSLRIGNNTQVIIDETSVAMSAGIVYFDSAGRDASQHIEVVTPFGTVRDIGTQFEVRSASDSLRLRVRSGRVELLDSAADQNIAVDSGEQFLLDSAGVSARSNIAPDNPEWDWAQQLATVPEFNRPTILRYLTWIAQETGRTLEFESETVRLAAEIARFLGDTDGLNPTEVLVTIAATSDFGYELTSEGTLLISRVEQIQQ